ncbi:MAG TPA: histidine phosphatase family protein [Gemmatimonadales bacterium]|nr:histidine phosphatase family protein [Gemmatimonadales bacterium]
MQLLLIRHADAGSRDSSLWADDRQRPLTEKGRRGHRRVAKRLRRRRLAPATVFSSPWLRAWQTAQITCDVTGSGEPVALPALAEPPDCEAIASAIGSPGPDEVIALVGHEPWLGELASLLLAGDAHRVAVDFPKSGVLGLECRTIVPATAQLAFFWRPKGS